MSVSGTRYKLAGAVLVVTFIQLSVPTSYDAARIIIQPLLLPTQHYNVCINDCIIYRKDFAQMTMCPHCKEPRYVAEKTAKKMFVYMPMKPRLERLLGDAGLAKLLTVCNRATVGSTTIHSILDGSVAETWFEPGAVFPGYEEGAMPLLLFTDGVNPIK